MADTQIKRRKFLGQLSAAGLLSAVNFLPGASLAETPGQELNLEDETYKFLTRPYLQNPSPTAMSIMWITDKRCYSWVEYGETEKLGSMVNSAHDGLVDAYNLISSVRVSGLKPATQYFYRAGAKLLLDSKPTNIKTTEAIYSEIYSFTTPAANPEKVSFLMMNDIHDRPESIPHLMKLNGENEFDFVFFNGDVFNHQIDEQQIIDHMLNPCTDVFASRKPFLMSRGNHETRGKYAREIYRYFTNRDDKFYNSFQWGPVYFIVLDTGEDKEDDHKEYAGLAAFDAYRKKQAEWLEKEMQTKAFKKAKYRVVLMHIPHFYTPNADAHGTAHCRELFAPLFDKYKVDLTLSGHTHRYGIHPPVQGKHNYPVIIGGGPQDGKRTITRIEANSRQLNVRMLRDDGVEVGTYVIKASTLLQ